MTLIERNDVDGIARIEPIGRANARSFGVIRDCRTKARPRIAPSGGATRADPSAPSGLRPLQGNNLPEFNPGPMELPLLPPRFFTIC